MIPVTGLNHAVLYVRELNQSVNFYQSVLGFVEVGRLQGKMALLKATGSQNHHDLGLIALGINAPSPAHGTVGLYHLGWEVKLLEDLVTATQVLKDQGYWRGASDHGASKSVYGEDPDGNQFEITWIVPRESWGEFEHKAIVAPLDLERELQQHNGRVNS